MKYFNSFNKNYDKMLQWFHIIIPYIIKKVNSIDRNVENAKVINYWYA